MITRIRNLFKKRFIKDTIVLQFASVFSTGLSFIASVVFARTLGVEGYSAYALIFAFVGIVGIFMNIGTNQSALTLLSGAYAQKDRDKARNILTYYVQVTGTVLLVVGFSIILISPFLTKFFYGDSTIGQLARVIILVDIIKIFFGMYIIVLQVIRQIKILAVIENINKVFYVAVPVTLVLIGWGLKGIVFGHLIVASGFAVFAWISYSRLAKNDPILPSWSEIFSNMFKSRFSYYFRFGFMIAIDKNIVSLYSTLPIFILGLFSINDVAILKIAIAYAGLPLTLIGPVSRLLSVHLPITKSYSLSILKRDFVRSSVGSFLITSGLVVIFALMAPILIPLVYGQEYVLSVYLSFPLLVGSAITALGVGNGSAFRTLNLMRKSIYVNAVAVLTGAGVIYFFMKHYPITVSVYPVAAWVPVSTLIFYAYLLIYINLRIKEGRTYVNQ
ncbi:MAG TPA: oligosaccharide flippase family protein [bacterium]|nr:oligosaccharide flippase family protein [bacterium]HNS33683.1 oligosaccharide flippase family protein [bacterium]HOH67528.1 oligosaccharide flippase family protein [bacterium]HQA63931.1 oligosaccharide flippase family protein [bacterium]